MLRKILGVLVVGLGVWFTAEAIADGIIGLDSGCRPATDRCCAADSHCGHERCGFKDDQEKDVSCQCCFRSDQWVCCARGPCSDANCVGVPKTDPFA
jgi:hypothetical protein